MSDFRLMIGDVFEQLALLPDESVDTCITSPPYWGLRDYGYDGQIGLEPTLGEHLDVMVRVFDEVRRVLKPMGTCWINYGDCYATSPNGRSAADTNATGKDDRTFRDKPFSTIGPIRAPDPGQPFPADVGRRGGGNNPSGPIHPPVASFEPSDQSRRRGRSGNLKQNGGGGVNGIGIPNGRVVAGPAYVPDYARKVRGTTKSDGDSPQRVEHSGRVVAGGYLKPKDLCMIPNRLAIALQDAGWWVRAENIWGKPNPMPDSSGKYRPSTAHEKVWLLTKSAKSYYDAQAVKMPVSGGTHLRVAQNIAAQRGSTRAYGGTRPDQPPMKAMGAAPVVAPSIGLPFEDIGDVLASATPGGWWRPDAWSGDEGAHGSMRRRAGQNPKAAAADSGIRANESFQGSTIGAVEDRYLRNYEPTLAPLDVWHIATAAYADAHFATFPPALVVPCILGGCPENGTVLDPFGGAGTTALVAQALNRHSILIEMDEGYAELARARVMNGNIGLGLPE